MSFLCLLKETSKGNFSYVYCKGDIPMVKCSLKVHRNCHGKVEGMNICRGNPLRCILCLCIGLCVIHLTWRKFAVEGQPLRNTDCYSIRQRVCSIS